MLYDRIIDVTLYRRAKRVESLHKVMSPKGYTESVVNGQRIMTKIGKDSEFTTLTYDKREVPPAVEGHMKETTAVTSRIDFYEGKTHYIYAGTKTMSDGTYKDIYREIRARGPVYTYRTLDEMKQGVKPNGRMLETGDRCRVIQDGTEWNVVVQGSEDALLTETMVEVDPITLHIPCTDYSCKPDVTLSINLLPGQNCYGATLKIKNLNLGLINIRTWDKMIITAGYREGAKSTFTCPIFASYIESPNPDGVVVFEGLTVGSTESVLTDHLVELKFVQDKMPLRDLIRQVADGIIDGIEVRNSVSDDIMGREITIEKRTVYAQNGMAVLNWLRDVTSDFVDTITMGQSSVYLQLVGSTLTVMIIDGPSKTPELTQNIVSLDAVSGASFSGTALTVTAPWNPALQPGDLFYMPPNFINGSRLPNALSTRDYRNDDNLYRAITINLEFGTYGTTNRMSVLAVPAQWAGEMPEAISTDMDSELYQDAISEWKKRSKEETLEVTIGKEGKTEVADQRAKTQPSKKQEEKLFEDYNNILGMWDTWVTISTKEGSNLTCMSKVAEYYLQLLSGGPRLERGKMGNNREASYYETDADLKTLGVPQAIVHQQKTGIGAISIWIPLITLATYWQRDWDIKHGIPHNWSKIIIEDIHSVEANTLLKVPAFPSGSWRSNRARLSVFINIWRDFYKIYKDDPRSQLYKTAWKAMYYYLGGEGELD